VYVAESLVAYTSRAVKRRRGRAEENKETGSCPLNYSVTLKCAVKHICITSNLYHFGLQVCGRGRRLEKALSTPINIFKRSSKRSINIALEHDLSLAPN
jgi:hypothetical protein